MLETLLIRSKDSAVLFLPPHSISCGEAEGQRGTEQVRVLGEGFGGMGTECRSWSIERCVQCRSGNVTAGRMGRKHLGYLK